MGNNIDFLRIAKGLYSSALDMDFGDYANTREEDINLIATALKKLDINDINDSALIQALETIFE